MKAENFQKKMSKSRIPQKNTTKLDRKEKDLEEMKNHYTSMLNAAPVGIGVVVNREFKEVNSVFCEMTGYCEQELIGKSSRMIYSSESEFQKVGKVKYQQISEKGKGVVETQLKRKDGEIIDVLLSSVPLNGKDISSGTTFTVLDITRQKKSERDLKYRLDFERLISEISTEFINIRPDDFQDTLHVALGRICQFTNLDRAYLLLLSDDHSMFHIGSMWMKKSDPIGEFHSDPVPTEKIEWWLNTLQENEIFKIKHLNEIPKNQKYFRDTRIAAGIKSQLDFAIKDHGKLVGCLGLVSTSDERDFSEDEISILRIFSEIVSNVLERKKIEEALKKTEIQLLATLEATADGIVVQDEQGNLVSTSTNILDILGIQPSRNKILKPDAFMEAIHKNIIEPEKFLSTFYNLSFCIRKLLFYNKAINSSSVINPYCTLRL